MAVYVSEMRIKGNLPIGENPLPDFRRSVGVITHLPADLPEEMMQDLGTMHRVLPYKKQDRYSKERKDLTLPTVVLENTYLKATFVPSLGGKLWSLFDKEHHRELLMSNPVVQPGNLALRDAWTSGGIEFNFGSVGHTYFTCDHVYGAVLKDENGEDFFRFYEYERSKETVFQADFHLPSDSRQLFSHIRVENPTRENKTTYWWTNTAIPEDGETRILSSSENVVVICSGNPLTYEKLPFLSVMPGDLSYPGKATKSFDYFFQPEDGVKTTWEGGVNRDGFAFYDCSTAPLLYHKMFCWGNHPAGFHWQDSLSEKGKGNYIEIQAGFARSQLHDKPFPAGASIEWTQCFGGIKIDPASVHGNPLHEANEAFGEKVRALLPEEELLRKDEAYRKAALVKTEEKNLVHRGSGYGALERIREEKSKDGAKLPEQLCFPASSLGREQADWIELLETGILPERPPEEEPASLMTSQVFRKLLEKSFDLGGKNWYSLYHYGNMLFENWDDSVVAVRSLNWPEKDLFEMNAEEAWKESVSLKKNVWAYRNLAYLEHLRKNEEKTEEYYDALFELPASRNDFCFAGEYLLWLNQAEKYEKAWALYGTLPDHIKNTERVLLNIIKTAVRLHKFDFAAPFFYYDFSAVREGETGLTDLWFEMKAHEIADRKGLTNPSREEMAQCYDEAAATCPPPEAIDFRMNNSVHNPFREEKAVLHVI